jgi:hypothetical protein
MLSHFSIEISQFVEIFDPEVTQCRWNLPSSSAAANGELFGEADGGPLG